VPAGARKTDAGAIRNFFAELANEPWLAASKRKWWPGFVFHHTMRRCIVLVAASFVTSALLLSCARPDRLTPSGSEITKAEVERQLGFQLPASTTDVKGFVVEGNRALMVRLNLPETAVGDFVSQAGLTTPLHRGYLAVPAQWPGLPWWDAGEARDAEGAQQSDGQGHTRSIVVAHHEQGQTAVYLVLS
jgi:hypothetical protein